MGGSLALQIKKRKISDSVWALVRNKKRKKEIKRLKIFDEVSVELGQCLEKADLVVLATPVLSIISFIKEIPPFLGEKSVVTDIGSIKGQIIKVARKYLPDRFVGSHPLCGSERKGAIYACSDLYSGNLCVLVPIKKNYAFRLIKDFWLSLGMRVVSLSSSQHDKILTYTSGLPHFLSFAYTKTIPSFFKEFTAGSFRDIIRVSASNASVWADIFLTNSRNMEKAWEKFKKNGELLLSLVKESKKRKLVTFFKRINQKQSLFLKKSR